MDTIVFSYPIRIILHKWPLQMVLEPRIVLSIYLDFRSVQGIVSSNSDSKFGWEVEPNRHVIR